MTIFLPPEKSDARLNPTITVLLVFIFVQTIIASNGPKSEQIPIISIFTELTLFLSLMNLAFCAICEWVGAISDDRPMHSLVRWAGYPLVNIVYQKLQMTCLRLYPIMTIIRRNILNSWRQLKFRNTQVETVSSPTASFNTQESESLDGMINKKSL